MIKINFDDYKENKQYLLLFDYLIKQESQNKDLFLEDINITPSSYRRAKVTEQNIGNVIVNKLCEYFNIKKVTPSEVDKYQVYLNKIYYDYYYNINNNCTFICGKLDELINERNLFYPIFLLFKLLFTLISNKSQNIIINENEYLFNEVMKYKTFYNNDLKDLLLHIEILYDKDFNNKKIYLDSKNGITYSIISNKYLESEKYIECLYYANKAKEIFLKDENYKRIAYININIMSCYCYLNNYKKYYEMAYTQFFSLHSFNDFSMIRDITDKHFAISMIALNKYEELNQFFKSKSDITFTEMICLLISRYYINFDEFQRYLNTMEEVLKGDERLEILNIINKYLINNDKKQLKKLKNGIHENLIYVLKNS